MVNRLRNRRLARAAVPALLLLGSSAHAPLLAQDGVDRFSPEMGRHTFRFDYGALGYFDRHAQPQRRGPALFSRAAAADDDLSMLRQRLSFVIPLHQSATDEWLLTPRVTHLLLDTGARLPRSRAALPGSLWDVRVGGLYRHRFDTGIILGADLSIGSASDRPFNSGDEWAADANVFGRFPAGAGNDAWVAYLNYSSNRSFLPHVPLPGAGYQWLPDERLALLAGVPLSTLRWEVVEGLTFEGLYFVPREVRAKLAYRLLRPLSLYVGYDWTSDVFLRHDRADSDHRLFYCEQRVLGGLRWDLSEQCWLDVAAGYAFDRFFFEAEEYADRDDSRINIADGPLLRLQVGLRF
ncbi:MAG: hypothetical protein LC135_14965 [Phycisphaerae bacterium]|nr:hypothetical protein [Phycisphaerae bacterium]MCZ2401144.1 hypothetical protein [Phycisphaerae bacterium]